MPERVSADKMKDLRVHDGNLKSTAAWRHTSKYVRLRAADAHGMVACFTCGTRAHSQDMDAGHCFSAGNHKAVFFELLNLAPQCTKCNLFQHGNLLKFREYIVSRYGESAYMDLEEESKKPKRWHKFELDEISRLRKADLKRIGAK